MRLTRDDFAAWLGRYVEAWRSGDPDDIGALFADDAMYSYRAGLHVVNGRDAIIEAWLAEDESSAWEAFYEPLAIEADVHVAIGTSRYFDDDGVLRDEYSNVFVCRFDSEGRCTSFTEWWMRVGPEG